MLPMEFRMEVCKRMRQIKLEMDKFMEPLLAIEGLTTLQMLVLSEIYMGNAESVGSLVRQMNIGQANASTLCKKMEQDGFIRRVRASEDERIVRLALTDKGKGAIENLEKAFSTLDPFLAAYPPQKLKHILEGMQDMGELIHALTPPAQ